MSEPTVDRPQFAVSASICGQTEVGPTRVQNQDAIMVAGAVSATTGTRLSWSGAVTQDGVVAGVVDGMGGHAGGSDAAGLAALALAGADAHPRDWDTWFEALSARILAAGRAWGTPDMGAAAALIVLTGDELQMANVGDCRIYRVAGGHLGQISVDDRTGDPNSSVLTQALGGSRKMDAHGWRQPYKGGQERYVLCSDGVWETLDQAVLRDLCTAARPPDQIVDAITASIYSQNASDNCSVIIVDLVATPATPETSALEQETRRVDVEAIPRANRRIP